MDPLYSRIKARREALGLTQSELAERMGYTHRSAITKIESGKVDIPRSKIIDFAKALKLDPMELMSMDESPLDISTTSVRLSPMEEARLEKIRALDSDGRAAVDAVLSVEYTRCTRPKSKLEFDALPTRTINVYGRAAAGPSGEWFTGEEPHQATVVLDETSERAEYAVEVSGDSMEPDYEDGDLLLVLQTSAIDPGELGVFSYEGKGYFKKLAPDGTLASLNPKYAPIVPEEGPCLIQGRVIGKAERIDD